MDFYVYACIPESGRTPDILLSADNCCPAGKTTANSFKVGGFHCLCADVGTIAGHWLTGYVAGDVLPRSVWDLKHRPRCPDTRGMVYSPSGHWVIYTFQHRLWPARQWGGLWDRRYCRESSSAWLAVAGRIGKDNGQTEFRALSVM